ncbi:carbohydrate ABC transporter permease [Faecalispora sporosphaeroides]|uniref:carbohydrate ABC transporter permease n=1 Tax=Faecalispora sporosphaeroides TaxID=1549 RepID=UPI0015A5D146|nr:ABC transporter permease subunit [Faecalispora sporosphaeroides]
MGGEGVTVYKAKKAAGKIGLYVLVLVVVLPVLFPLYFVFISSLKNMSQVYIMPPQLFGFTPIWDHYKYIFETQHYDAYMVNSAVVAFASTAISLILGVPASYSIARFHMRKTSTSILVARLLPSISFLLPYYFLFSKLKMIDTYSVLILSHIVLSLPLIVWIMSSFIADIPKELDEAAIVDGCTRQRCFWNVILPVSLPGLVTCATLSFLGSWNNFQFALILSGEKTRTLPVSLQYFVSGADIRWGRMLAATIVVIVPAIILTMALQKYIIKGMTAGAVKG